eukprot:1746577-Prymnesium_polylepis.2
MRRDGSLVEGSGSDRHDGSGLFAAPAPGKPSSPTGEVQTGGAAKASGPACCSPPVSLGCKRERNRRDPCSRIHPSAMCAGGSERATGAGAGVVGRAPDD